MAEKIKTVDFLYHLFLGRSIPIMAHSYYRRNLSRLMVKNYGEDDEIDISLNVF